MVAYCEIKLCVKLHTLCTYLLVQLNVGMVCKDSEYTVVTLHCSNNEWSGTLAILGIHIGPRIDQQLSSFIFITVYRTEIFTCISVGLVLVSLTLVSWLEHFFAKYMSYTLKQSSSIKYGSEWNLCCLNGAREEAVYFSEYSGRVTVNVLVTDIWSVKIGQKIMRMMRFCANDLMMPQHTAKIKSPFLTVFWVWTKSTMATGFWDGWEPVEISVTSVYETVS